MIKIVDPRVITDWDEKMLKFEGYSIFYSLSWAEVLNEVYGYKPLYFTLSEGDEFIGVIPILEVNSFITGKRGISLPFTDICGPLVKDQNAFNALLEALMEYARKNHWRYAEIRGGSKFFDSDTQPSSVFYEHSVTVEAEDEDLFKTFHSTTKRNIKRSIREGVIATSSQSLESMESFYKLNCLTRKKHGLPPQPIKFFRKLHELIILKGNGFVVNASFENKTIASAVFLHFGNQIMYKYGASDMDYNSKRANFSTIWHGLNRAHELGLKKMSFGRTALSNAGLRKFKAGWGTEEEEITYYRYDVSKNQFVEHGGGVPEFYNTVFRRMPDSLLKLTGNLAYKHIA